MYPILIYQILRIIVLMIFNYLFMMKIQILIKMLGNPFISVNFVSVLCVGFYPHLSINLRLLQQSLTTTQTHSHFYHSQIHQNIISIYLHHLLIHSLLRTWLDQMEVGLIVFQEYLLRLLLHSSELMILTFYICIFFENIRYLYLLIYIIFNIS